ncbi:MAG: hypothetical protein HN742_37960 [Lentisphaerae bacterium]|jgi:Fe-S cluster assembly iron-binding protein IscA|nr:hypothetical protein [Lentisphaerota bacterium]MBT4820514.1 hypothetical protein [Lentisphaerota bacterium]MBT5608108.1 hypothetical protein [Lentisphaerota bacterium]MBT7060615.1 hypothetical protein [Lentisphaerota bacterium]MBT7847714.1 hypothetical protein [Lentisphaerota bacterium]
MTITESARERLQVLLGRAASSSTGFRYRGHVGTCRGSTPLLYPAEKAGEGEKDVVCNGIQFFVPERFRELFDVVTLDFDDAPLFRRGLYLTWPHGTAACGCQCHD